MKISLAYIALLDERGTPLAGAFGIRDIALHREDALLAAGILLRDDIAILGGDVYFDADGRLEIAYANWCSDQNPGESTEAYLQRAFDKSIAYIRNFPEKQGFVPLFALVPDFAESYPLSGI